MKVASNVPITLTVYIKIYKINIKYIYFVKV